MTKYNTLNVELFNSKLNKLKSGIKMKLKYFESFIKFNKEC